MKVCILTDPKNTVWDPNESSIQEIVDYTVQPWQANIWVANQEWILRDQLEKAIQANKKRPKACFLWTHEPYFSTTTAEKIQIYDCPVYIFNIWNGKALKQNGTFLAQKFPLGPPQRQESQRTEWRSQGKPLCALMTYPQETTKFTQDRLRYAISGHTVNILDIYGKGWPPGFSLENSRDGAWWESKPSILAKYDYNLALENCVKPYYVTEKLWDSILNGCLPIYCQNGTIYEDFPRESFLDVNDFRSMDQLWEKVKSMSLSEWNARMNLCWKTTEEVWKRTRSSKDSLWNNSILEIQEILETLN